MPDGSPLPSELFKFTTEEVAMVPGILEHLVPPHLKDVSSAYNPSSGGAPPAPTSSSTASLPAAALQTAVAAVADPVQHIAAEGPAVAAVSASAAGEVAAADPAGGCVNVPEASQSLSATVSEQQQTA
jgi:hypothetical protein